MGYYKIMLKPKRGGNWMDDYNTPGKTGQTKRYRSLALAKKAMRRNTWGIPHVKKIVYVKNRTQRTQRKMGFNWNAFK